MTDAPLSCEEAERLLALCEAMDEAHAERERYIDHPVGDVMEGARRARKVIDAEHAFIADAALPRALREVLRLQEELAEARQPRDRTTTHAEGCWAWRHHHECAIGEIERMQAEIARLRRALDAAGIVLGSET